MSQEIADIGAMRRQEHGITDRDQALMMRLQRGDAAAMTDLVRRFGPGLNRLIGQLTGWNADTDDILQEVMLTAWRKAGSYQGKGSLEGWLRRLAVNHCRNHRRGRATFARILRRFAGLRTATRNEQTTNESIATARLRSAMSRLKNCDRAVLVLFYLEQLSGEEVAAALNVRQETLHVRLHRARLRLRELMDADHESHE